MTGGNDQPYNLCLIPLDVDDGDADDAADHYEEFVDDCAGGGDDEKGFEPCFDRGTNWTAAWTFNGNIMLFQSFNLAFMAVGAYIWKARLLGALINTFCSVFCMCPAYIVLFAARFSTLGKFCALNQAPSTYDGSYHGDLALTNSYYAGAVFAYNTGDAEDFFDGMTY